VIETFTAADPANHTARLSAQGVKMACALQPFSVASLALWLYLFNRYPAFPKWHSRFRSNTDDDSLLGVDLGTAVSGKDWRRVSLDEQANDWHVWSRRVDSKSVNQPSKLYVSMNCNDLVSILPKAGPSFVGCRSEFFQNRSPYLRAVAAGQNGSLLSKFTAVRMCGERDRVSGPRLPPARGALHRPIG
jgi:hypothetical protein